MTIARFADDTAGSADGSSLPHTTARGAAATAPQDPSRSAVSRPRVGYAQVMAGAVLFGVAGSVSKVALTAGIEPARLAALRCTGTALCMLVVVMITRPSRVRITWRDVPALAVLGLCGAALIQWLYFVAIDRLPVGIALLLEFTGPLLVAVYSRIVLRHVVSRQVWLALALALGGLALVAQVWRDAGLDAIGVAAGLGAATCLATFHLVGKQTVERHDPMSLSLWMFAFASAFWAVAQPWWNFDASILTERTSLLGSLDGTTIPVWLAVAWVIVLGTLAPYALEITALRHLMPPANGIVGTMEPVIAAIVAWVWLDQVLNTTQVLGGIVVLGGVALVQLAHREPEQHTTPIPTDAPL